MTLSEMQSLCCESCTLSKFNFYVPKFENLTMFEKLLRMQSNTIKAFI